MDLIYSEIQIKTSHYLTSLWWAQRHLRIRQWLMVTDFHWTVLRDREGLLSLSWPWVFTLKRVYLNKVLTHLLFMSFYRLKMYNKGSFTLLIVPTFLIMRMYYLCKESYKNTNQKLKVKRRVFGSQENRSLLWLEVRLTTHNNWQCLFQDCIFVKFHILSLPWVFSLSLTFITRVTRLKILNVLKIALSG